MIGDTTGGCMTHVWNGMMHYCRNYLEGIPIPDKVIISHAVFTRHTCSVPEQQSILDLSLSQPLNLIEYGR